MRKQLTYSFIKKEIMTINFNRSVDSQESRDTNFKKHYCKRCFQYYTRLELLQKHIKFCSTNRESAIPIMPKPF